MARPSSEGLTKRGWLMKRGGIMKSTWQHRYFVLSGRFLIYYIKEDDIKSQGSILLDQHRILEQPISPDEPDHFIFEIVLAKSHRNTEKKNDNHETVCLCASSDAERQGWIKALRHALYAKLGGAIFGQKIEETMKYEHQHNRKIPFIIEECVEFIYKNGLKAEGLFRLPGRASVIRDLKEKFDCGEQVSLAKYEADVHSVSSLLKLYLRELPESIIPCKHYQKFMNFALRFLDAKEESVKLNVVADLKAYMPHLPVDNYNILKYLCQMLNAVGQHSSVNKMSMLNIATVFGPNIIRHMDDNPELFMMTADIAQQLAFMLINYFDIVFELEYDSGSRTPEPVPVEDLLRLSQSDDQHPVLQASSVNKGILDLEGLRFEDVAAQRKSNTDVTEASLSPLEFSDSHFPAEDNDVVLRHNSASSTPSLQVNSPKLAEDGRPVPPKRKSKIVRGQRVSRTLSSQSEPETSIPTSPDSCVPSAPDSQGPSAENKMSSQQSNSSNQITKETQTSSVGRSQEQDQYFTQADMEARIKEIDALKEIITKQKSKYDTTVKALRAEIDNMKEKYEKRIETLEAVFKTQNAKFEAESRGRAEAVEAVVKLKQQLHQYQMQYGDLAQS